MLLNSLAGPLMQDSSEGKGQSAKLGKARGGGMGVLLYISYIGMCCPKAGKGFLGSPSLNTVSYLPF